MNTFEKFLIKVILCLGLFGLSNSSDMICQTDNQCQAKFNERYVCDTSTNKCNRELIFTNFSWFLVFGFVLILLFNLLSYTIGTSANSLNFPLLIFLFEFTSKDTMSTVKIGNVFMSFINFLFIINMRDKGNGNRLYTNFELILLLLPLIIIGSMMGNLAFYFLPAVLSYILIFIVMIVLSIRNWGKFQDLKNAKIEELDSIKQITSLKDIEIRSSEKKIEQSTQIIELKDDTTRLEDSKPNFESSIGKGDNPILSNFLADISSKGSSPDISEEQSDEFTQDSIKFEQSRKIKNRFVLSSTQSVYKEEYPSLGSLLWEKKFMISLFLVCFSIMVMSYLIKGTNSRASILGLPSDSLVIIVIFLLCMIPLVYISWLGYKEMERTYSNSSEGDTSDLNFSLVVKLASAALIAGFLSTSAVSSTLFLWAALFFLGLEPLVVKCTVGWMIFMIAVNNCFQFIYMGYFDWKNILVISGVSLFGCFAANLYIKKELANNNSRSINIMIAGCCFAMTVCLCIVIPFTSIFEYHHNKSFLSFGSVS